MVVEQLSLQRMEAKIMETKFFMVNLMADQEIVSV